MKHFKFVLLAGLSLSLLACADAKTEPGKDASVPAIDAGASTPDAGPQRTGHTATDTVPGGVKASSPNYRLIGTSGKTENSPSSPNYKVRKGVVGASQE